MLSWSHSHNFSCTITPCFQQTFLSRWGQWSFVCARRWGFWTRSSNTHCDLLQEPGSNENQANFTLYFLGKKISLFGAQLYGVSKKSVAKPVHPAEQCRSCVRSSKASPASQPQRYCCMAQHAAEAPTDHNERRRGGENGCKPVNWHGEMFSKQD